MIGAQTGHIAAAVQLVIWLGLGAVLYIAAWYARRLLLPLKIVADVVRFVGDREYCTKLLDHLDQKIGKSDVRPADRVILVGHSLGSAIALLWLLERRAESYPTRQFVFVTMGSPIKRWLWRFFPGICPAADQAFLALQKHNPTFRWLNVHRPRDPIGGQLFENQHPNRREDKSTGQWEKAWINAHVDYWDDERVNSLVYEFVANAPPEETCGQPKNQPCDLHLNPSPYWHASEAALRFHEKLYRWVLWPASALCAFCFSCSNASRMWEATAEPYREDPAWVRQRLVAPGSQVRETVADLFTYNEIGPSSSAETAAIAKRKDFVAVFSPKDDGERIAVKLGPMHQRWEIPVVEPTDEETVVKRWLTFDPATKRQIRIRFLADDETVIDFPDLSPVASNSATGIYTTVVSGLGAVVRCIFTIGTFIVMFVAVGWLLLLTGKVSCALPGEY